MELSPAKPKLKYDLRKMSEYQKIQTSRDSRHSSARSARLSSSKSTRSSRSVSNKETKTEPRRQSSIRKMNLTHPANVNRQPRSRSVKFVDSRGNSIPGTLERNKKRSFEKHQTMVNNYIQQTTPKSPYRTGNDITIYNKAHSTEVFSCKLGQGSNRSDNSISVFSTSQASFYDEFESR